MGLVAWIKTDVIVAIKPLLGDMLSILFSHEHDLGFSVPQRLVLRRCVMNDTLRDSLG